MQRMLGSYPTPPAIPPADDIEAEIDAQPVGFLDGVFE